MDNSATENNQIVSSEITDQDNTKTPFVPQEPIILNPGADQTKTQEIGKRSFLSTLSLLFAGWLVGNLVILAIVGLFTLGVVGSTGLVKVPVLTSLFFGDSQPIYKSADQNYLEEAQEKLNEISVLKKGQEIESFELSEAEINALLNDKIMSATGFPIGNQNLRLVNGRFVFTGNLLKTNAPIEVQGSIEVYNLTAKVNIDQAKFGKITLPSFVAASIVDGSFSKIGLSLSAGSIPAESLKIQEGAIVLEKVVNPNN